MNKKIERAKITFEKKAKAIHGDKYDYSEVEYIKSSIKVKIKCKKCQTEFWQTPNNHLNGQGCPKCKLYKLKYNQQKTFDDFVADAIKIHGDIYKYIKNTYDGAKHKMKILCKKCNKYFYQTPDKHLIGHGCPKCSVELSHKKQLKSRDQFLIEAKQVHNDKYDYSMVEYLGRNVPILVKCNECGQIFKIRPCQHLRGQGCLFCHRRISKGERKVAEFFEKHEIKYIEQKKFKDCIYKQSLLFDFYLPDYNACIEYQGKQHYFISTLFDKTTKSFEERQIRDQIKKKYCENNNIKLVEIRYDEDIEKKLELEILNKIM